MIKTVITDIEQLKTAVNITDLKIEEVDVKENLQKIIEDLKDTLWAQENCLALSAPQIGYTERIIGIKFNDGIKIFINPVVTKKLKYAIGGETCASMPGKEILIARPEEISLVYYNESFVYEDNKLLGVAARLFDQQYQFMEGVTPDELGLVSDIEQDGPISDLTAEEFEQVKNIYKQLIQVKTKALEDTLLEDDETKKQYKELKFAEQVISGRALILENEEERQKLSKARKQAAVTVAKSIADSNKAAQKAQLKSFLGRRKR